MKSQFVVLVGTGFLLASGVASAQQYGNMMGDGGMWSGTWMGGYGGIWLPVLVVALIAGLVIWAVKQKSK